MSRGGLGEDLRGFGFPRVSGDEPGRKTDWAATWRFSPRERG